MKHGHAVSGGVQSSLVADLLLNPWLWIVAIVLVGFTLSADADELTQSCDSPPIVAPSVEPGATPACEDDDEGDDS